TFSYITGFADFVILTVPLLLACAVQQAPRLSSRLHVVAAGLLVATAPMSGSRATVLYVLFGCPGVLGLSGTFGSSRGKAALVVLVVAAGAGVWAAPDATQGVQDRF